MYRHLGTFDHDATRALKSTALVPREWNVGELPGPQLRDKYPAPAFIIPFPSAIMPIVVLSIDLSSRGLGRLDTRTNCRTREKARHPPGFD